MTAIYPVTQCLLFLFVSGH